MFDSDDQCKIGLNSNDSMKNREQFKTAEGESSNTLELFNNHISTMTRINEI